MNLKLPDLVTRSVFEVVKENFHRVKLVFHRNINANDFETEILTFTRLEKVIDRFQKFGSGQASVGFLLKVITHKLQDYNTFKTVLPIL